MNYLFKKKITYLVLGQPADRQNLWRWLSRDWHLGITVRKHDGGEKSWQRTESYGYLPLLIIICAFGRSDLILLNLIFNIDNNSNLVTLQSPPLWWRFIGIRVYLIVSKKNIQCYNGELLCIYLKRASAESCFYKSSHLSVTRTSLTIEYKGQRWWDITPLINFGYISLIRLLVLKKQTVLLWMAYGKGHVANCGQYLGLRWLPADSQ